MDIRQVFGDNLRRFRTQAGLSQEAVAERMGVDRAYVSSMER
ncbi:helix-turn-helix domain-containing protein, partial [Acidiphilium sp.]